MAKLTFLIWMLASPLIAGTIAWIVQHARQRIYALSHCATANPCEIMPQTKDRNSNQRVVSDV